MAIQGFFTGDVKIRDLNGVLKAVDGIVEVATDAGTVTSVGLTVGSTGTDVNVANSPVTTSGNITLNLPTASATNRGLLSSADWAIFDAKQGSITLTTTGNNGSATLTSGTLNIPTYTLAGLGGISLTSLSASSPLSYNNTTGAFSIQVANGSQNGYLSSSDWTTFNSKQGALTFSSPLVNTAGTVSIPAATSSVNGYLTSTDWVTFNAKQGAITLTTTGSSGAATLIGTTLNIPNYSGALTGYVPYTGATGNVDLGEYGISSGYFQADLTPSGSLQVGRMQWNSTDGTMDLRLMGNNVTLQIGQEQVARVVNGTGGNLLEANYQAVKIIGAQGQRLQVGLARADNDANSKDTLGLVTENINNNQEGFITVSGLVNEINTTGSLQGETWADGDTLYLSGTTSGAITNVKPSAPIHTVIVGFVVYAHANHGKIFVKVDNGYELEELHDVAPTPYVNKGVLYRDTATNLWKSATIGTLLGYTPANAATTLTINGTAYDLSTNRTWNVGTVTSVGTSGPLTGGTITGSGTIGITQATTSTDGYLSSTDWNTFNGKQAAGSYITALTGEATASGPGSATVTLSTSAVTGKLLTGLNLTGGGTIAATDSILQAFGKVQNQISGMVGGVTFQGTWNASTNTPTLTSSVGTKGYYYIVDVAGSTNLNGITDWKIGDWAIFNGTTWDKVDNTDAVSSVNGFTGAVSLTTSNIAEGTNLYYLDSRARLALSFTAGSGAYDNTTGVITIPTNTSQLTNGANFITLSSLSASSPLSYNSGTGAFSIQVANGSQNGYLSSTDWTKFNNNIPAGTPATGDYIFYNGSNLAYRGFIATAPLSYNSSTATFSISQANGSTDGYLSSTDWTTFNNKQSALTNPVTGTGTTNYLPKFTGTSTIGNSAVTDDGTTVTLVSRALSGTSASFSGAVNANVYNLAGLTGGGALSWTTNTLRLGQDSYFQNLQFWTNGSERMRLDASGNLGLGVTPSAWESGFNAIEVDNVGNAIFGRGGSDMRILSNAYYDGAYKYAVNGAASTYQQTDGKHIWFQAGAGTAGNAISFTQAMTLNASGNLSIGNTNDTYKLDVSGTGRFTGTLTAATLTDGFITIGAAQINRTSATVEMQFSGSGDVRFFGNTAYPITFAAGTGAATFSSRINGVVGGTAYNTAGLWLQGSSSTDGIAIGGTGSGDKTIDTYGGTLKINGTAGNGLSVTGAATFSSSVTAVGLFSTTSASGTLAAKIRNGITAASGSTGYGLAIESEASAATSYALTVRNLAESTTYFHISTETGKVGNVGIGTTSPTYKLDVVNSGSNTIRVQNTLNTSDSYLLAQNTLGSTFFGINATGGYIYNGEALPILFYTTGSERLRITSGGNVGIGTTSPAGQFEVYTDVYRRLYTSNIDAYTIRLVLGANSYFQQDAANEELRISQQYGGGKITFYTGATNTERMRITSGGNVGIGTTAPGYKLDVFGSSGNVTTDMANGTLINIDGGSITSTNFGVGLAFVRTGSQMAYIKAARENASDEAGFLAFATQTGAGTHPERMRIESGYSVRYTSNNASNATFDLNYRFSTPDSARIRFSTTSSFNLNEPGEISFWTRANDAQGGGLVSERMRITSGGLVGIGTASPNYKLEVNGSFSTVTSSIYLQYNSGILYHYGGSGDYYQYINGANYLLSNRTATGALVFSTQDNERLRITSGGQVGIGTSSPTQALHVVGNSYISGRLDVGMTPSPFWNARFRDYSDGSGVYIGSVAAGGYKFIAGDSYYENSGNWYSDNTTSAVVNLTGGNFTVYTNSGLTANTNFTPTARFNINPSGVATFNNNVGINGGSTSFPLTVRVATNQNVRISSETSTSIQAVNNAADAYVALKVDGSSLLLNSQSGANVGIGTTSPTRLFDVSATNPQMTLKSTTTTGFSEYYFSDSAGDPGYLSYAHNGDYLVFGVNSAERMRITSGGTLLVGTTTEAFAGGKLQVEGTIRAAGQFTSVLPSSNFGYFDGSGQVVASASSASSLYLDATWNTTGNPDAIFLNITNTASGASAKLLNLKVGSVSQFNVSKAGAITTSAPSVGSAHAWKLGSYAAGGTGTATGVIYIEVNGQIYSIPALLGTP